MDFYVLFIHVCIYVLYMYKQWSKTFTPLYINKPYNSIEEEVIFQQFMKFFQTTNKKL